MCALFDPFTSEDYSEDGDVDGPEGRCAAQSKNVTDEGNAQLSLLRMIVSGSAMAVLGQK